MSHVTVSLRIPKSMLIALKDLAVEKHCMDTSELVRSILRKKWQDERTPDVAQITKLREDIVMLAKQSSNDLTTMRLLSELERIKSELERRGPK